MAASAKHSTSSGFQNIVDYRQVTAVGSDEVIETLRHTPSFRRWLPVQLVSCETAEDFARIIGDRVGLGDETINLTAHTT